MFGNQCLRALHRPAALAPLESVMEVKILGSHCRPAESDSKWGPEGCVPTVPLGCSLRVTHCVQGGRCELVGHGTDVELSWQLVVS